ncbi:hypothetical protein [Paenibacillus eucommiae]|uniref:Uncharacterized protein n=1 Tax=Paenibacillus eucommiae TaxID=1355755 RepID=A0ABS4IX60_9BACL|nr:hypothetical protein [Paenibacillus eucommiae]MBP1992147.1 hypothetical protein [Paenibacillus eucommiae]
MKKVILFIFMIALFSLSMNAFAASEKEFSYEGIAYNKIELNQTKTLSDISVKKSEKSVTIGFNLDNKKYKINADLFGSDDNGTNKYYAEANEHGIQFNISEYKGSFSGVAVNKDVSPINFTEEDTLGFVISSGEPSAELIDSLQSYKVENQDLINSSVDNINRTPLESTNAIMATQLHVHANATGIPFLISGGSAEGWCNSFFQYGTSYSITNMQYYIVYNWPSDGISLWTDYMGSVNAYYSPTFPSSGMTNVSGSWIVSSTTGMFMAEVSYSALAGTIPLMYTKYDTSTIY